MDSLSEDCLAIICGWLDREELLVVRALSRAGRGAVQLAVKTHKSCEYRPFSNTSETLHRRNFSAMSVPKAAAVGRVLGGGCRTLYFSYRSEQEPQSDPHDKFLEAFYTFVPFTSPPGLQNLQIGDPEMRDDQLLEMCRNCPRLVYLCLPGVVVSRSLAARISLACPLLESVYFKTGDPPISEAEDFAMEFPKLKILRFGNRSDSGMYIPSKLEMIEESAARCLGADMLDFEQCIVVPALADCLLRTSLPSRVTRLFLEESAISRSTILVFATAFQKLRTIYLPEVFAVPFDSEDHVAFYESAGGSPAFYQSLWNARPTITALSLSGVDATTLELVCRLFPLESLTVLHHNMEFGSTTLVDIILASPCRGTLKDMRIAGTGFSEALRLVTTMGNLKSFSYYDWGDPSRDSEAEQEFDEICSRIRKIIVGRGGEFDCG